MICKTAARFWLLLAAAAFCLAGAAFGEEPAVPAAAAHDSAAKSAAAQDTLWIIPQTHWEGAVFKTREEYLEIGLPHILHALQLLRQYPDYTFTLDQVAYVRPFLERYPEHEAEFRKYVAQGRLALVLGMDVMPDVNKPGAESLVRQIQYGKGYYRRKLGVDVTTAWLVDSFGFHPQMPQILKLAGYKSFWFSRGIPNAEHPSEFLWEGIDGTTIPSVWLPRGYGIFSNPPKELPAFETFAKERFDLLTRASRGHDRVAPSGNDVSDPDDQLPAMMQAEQASGHDLGFKLRFGTPGRFDDLIARRPTHEVFKGEFNPIFQGTYSSRIELKQSVREMERLLTTAEKLGVLAGWLGSPPDNAALWKAWELVVFNETHDLASGVMTDHVYEDVQRELGVAKWLANGLIDSSWNNLSAAIDTRGQGTPIVVFNPLGWPRSDVAYATLSFGERFFEQVEIRDSTGALVPTQILQGSSIRNCQVAFAAREVPPMGYSVYHAVARRLDPNNLVFVEPTDDTKNKEFNLENEHYRIVVDRLTGAMLSLHVKNGNWDAIRAPANVVARQEDKGDLWELYQDLSNGGKYGVTQKQPVPNPSPTTVLSDHFHAELGELREVGPVFSEFTISHPFDNGKFSTTVRLAAGSRRIDIYTRLVNNSKQVRYQAMFPTTIKNGRNVQSIPFGSVERPEGIEFPAQDWVDYSDRDGQRGVALLNVGLPGNLVSDGTLLVSLLRAHNIAHYGFVGGYEKGTSSDTGFELGQERTLHYALVPHRGDWRKAEIYREGMEFNHPLICRKAAPHAGSLPPRWGLLTLSQPNVVVSSLQSGRDGAALLRVYEAAGQNAKQVKLTLATPILAASETNLMEDPGAELKPDGNSLTFDLAPYQIKTLSLRLERPPRDTPGRAANHSSLLDPPK